MIRNYLTIAWRNLLLHKTFSLINILGLAIGMAACLLIFLYVHDELSYDQFHEKADRIYRVTTLIKTEGSEDEGAGAGIDVGPVLQQTYPEVEEAVRFNSVSVATVKKGEQLFNEKDFYRVDPRVFAVFSYPLLMGNPALALAKPHSIVLTEGLARKYFGKASPMGKSLRVDGQPYLVTGVLADLPSHTDLKFTALLPLLPTPAEQEDWLEPAYYTFLLFKSQQQATQFEPKLRQFGQQQYAPRIKALGELNFSIAHRMQPLTQVHFAEGLFDDTPKGNRTYLTIFSLTAFFILLVAGINYLNLFMAQATRRQKEVGVRKVVGSSQQQLWWQFIGESLLLTLVSGLLALTLVQVVTPAFNQFTEKSFTLLTIPDWKTALVGVGIVFLIALAAGSYPAFFPGSRGTSQCAQGKVGVVGQAIVEEGAGGVAVYHCYCPDCRNPGGVPAGRLFTQQRPGFYEGAGAGGGRPDG